MSNYINEALLDSSPMKKQAEEAKNLVGKWDKTGLLDGLNEDFKRQSMAVLLENQAKQLINEFSTSSPNAGVAGGNYKGDEEWSGVALPLVRRIFGEIAAQEFVSVQPMNLPSGLVFYLDFQHGKSRMGFSAGDSIHGNTGPFSPSGSSSPYPDKGFYGTGKYGYTVGTGSAQSLNVTGSLAAMSEINFDTENSASGMFKVTGTITGPVDTAAVRGWDVDLSDFAPGTVTEYKGGQYRSISGDDTNPGTLTLILKSDESLVPSGSVSVKPIVSNTESSRGDFEDTTANATQDSLQIPEVDLKLRSRPIVAKTRKLKAVWTPELAQDLNAYHSVDAEAELTSMLILQLSYWSI